MKAHYVLVDFENVQPRNLGLLKGGPFKLKVFVGASQTKVSLDLAQAVQSFGSDGEYIQITGNGSNALDFHIAYYIGVLSAADPTATFHIISKDTGFDPLVKHLKARGIECKRSAAITDIPHIKSATLSPAVKAAVPAKPAAVVKAAPVAKKTATKATAAKSAPGKPTPAPAPPPTDKAAAARYTAVLENLVKRKAGRPRTLKTLTSTIRALTHLAIDEAGAQAIVKELTRQGKLRIDGSKVTYVLG